MFDYHVVTFDEPMAARHLANDLAELQVPNFHRKGNFAVAIRVPEGTDNAAHMAAVKAISLGRGSHTVRHEVF